MIIFVSSKNVRKCFNIYYYFCSGELINKTKLGIIHVIKNNKFTTWLFFYFVTLYVICKRFSFCQDPFGSILFYFLLNKRLYIVSNVKSAPYYKIPRLNTTSKTEYLCINWLIISLWKYLNSLYVQHCLCIVARSRRSSWK